MIIHTLYTTVKPLFAAEGTSRSDGDDEIVVFVYPNYDLALAKGKELLHQSYSNVSVYRMEESA